MPSSTHSIMPSEEAISNNAMAIKTKLLINPRLSANSLKGHVFKEKSLIDCIHALDAGGFNRELKNVGGFLANSPSRQIELLHNCLYPLITSHTITKNDKDYNLIKIRQFALEALTQLKSETNDVLIDFESASLLMRHTFSPQKKFIVELFNLRVFPNTTPEIEKLFTDQKYTTFFLSLAIELEKSILEKIVNMPQNQIVANKFKV